MSILTTQTIEYEAAATPFAFAAMTDSGDHTVFTTTNKPLSRADADPVIGGYGLITGGAVIPAVSATNSAVDTAAMELFAPGMTGASATTGKITIAADTDVACTRGSTTNTHIINSITVDTSGAVAVVAGTATTAFSETRAAAGGPPLIPVGSVEIAQVRFTSTAAAAVASSEIYSAVGTHQERYDYPSSTVDYLNGKLTFGAALPLIHTGPVAKRVYVRGSTPIFSEIPNAKDWVPAETADSTTSETNYTGTIAASISTTLNQASFTASMSDGVTDSILGRVGKRLIFRFKPSRNGTAYQLTQGFLNKTRTFGVKANPVGSFTIAPDQASVDFAS